jgi:phosphoglycolate phosphatase
MTQLTFSSNPLLVFDLDGTLVDSLDDLADALNRMPARAGLPALDADTIRPMVGDGVAALVRRAMAHDGRPAAEADIAGFTRDYEANAALRTRPFPGMVDMLEVCARRGWRLAVCTNKPETAARALLDGIGLGPYFAAVGGGDSFATRKPEPGHLVATIATAQGSIGRAVMIGDHHNDIAAAAGAHVPSIFAGWGFGSPAMGETADAVAADCAEVPALAQRLLGL